MLLFQASTYLLSSTTVATLFSISSLMYLLLEVALIGLGKKLQGRAEEKEITDKRQQCHRSMVKC